MNKLLPIDYTLFENTTHSPSLIDLVGYARAQQVVGFCFIANPYYPTPPMVDELIQHLPRLIKHYPSSNPQVSARHLAAMLQLRVIEDMRQLSAGLAQVDGITVYPTGANFVCFRIDTGMTFLFLNTLANFASPSLGEKLIFGPLALVAAVACLVVAWSHQDA